MTYFYLHKICTKKSFKIIYKTKLWLRIFNYGISYICR